MCFDGDTFSTPPLEGHWSTGRITKALGFSLGTNNASALGVLGVSSSSLKNGTYKGTQVT